MRAVRCKDGVVTLIHRNAAQLFGLVEASGWLDATSLDERTHAIAQELVQTNVLKATNKEGRPGYETYSQKITN